MSLSLNLPSKLELFAYPCFVLLWGIAGVLMLGPGSVLTLTFLIGIITIPFAFVVGAIPTVALTLALSLPFYFFQIFIWPTKTARNIFLSVLLGLGLSVSICQIMTVYLTAKAKELITTDIVHHLDLTGKSVLVIGARDSDQCGDICEMLVFFGGARKITIIDKPVDGEFPSKFKGNSFELLPTNIGSCEHTTNSIAGDLRVYFAANGRCVRKIEDDTMHPNLIFVMQDKIKPDHGTEVSEYDPFLEAIDANRTSVFTLEDGKAAQIFQFTAVSARPPAPVLIPFSIAKGPHSDKASGFFRRSIKINEMPALEDLFFSEQQLLHARNVLKLPSNTGQILEFLEKEQLSKQQKSLVWSYVDGVILKGQDRSLTAFEIAGRVLASGEFASYRLAPELIVALRPDTDEQWTILSRSLFTIVRHYKDIAHNDDLLKVRNYLTVIGREIAKLPSDQLWKHRNQLEMLARDPLTINATYSAFGNISNLGEDAFPILRASFRSAKTAFENSDNAKRPHSRIQFTWSYRTAISALCDLAASGKIDGSAIHELLDDDAVVESSTFLRAIAFTDFSDFERLETLRDNANTYSRTPKEIILEYRNKFPDKPCS
ncbi:hypothetical protein [uncultured Roseibium sp.]|uniref:hypothetical protein n=1 Tax=uncultured Roseibium sp. TaxID=1936171 RepID=UPI002620442F|nr:hypothetical protein [uncultured Roseibium sp.]